MLWKLSNGRLSVRPGIILRLQVAVAETCCPADWYSPIADHLYLPTTNGRRVSKGPGSYFER